MDPLYFFVALLIGAVLLVLLSKAKDMEMEWFRKNGIQTQGTVVKNTFCWGRISVTRPVVRFTTEHGEIIESMGEKGLALAVLRFSVGQKIILI
jgi:hypothetical protein